MLLSTKKFNLKNQRSLEHKDLDSSFVRSLPDAAVEALQLLRDASKLDNDHAAAEAIATDFQQMTL